MNEIDRVLFDASVKIGRERVRVIEEMIELHLQPRLRWMPAVIWCWFIKKLLVMKIKKEG